MVRAGPSRFYKISTLPMLGNNDDENDRTKYIELIFFPGGDCLGAIVHRLLSIHM